MACPCLSERDMCPTGQTSQPCCGTSGVYLVSSLATVLGYCLFVAGVGLPSWREEIGYTYGLWVRCDGDVCRHVFVGLKGFMPVVQGGIIISMLLLTVSVACLLLETCLRCTRPAPTHLARAGKVMATSGAMGEILAAFTLAYYGYNTVMAVERLPVLTTGFAVTGLGVMTLLLGSILRAMGPLATWGDGVCCLGPTHRHKQQLLHNMATECPSLESYDPTMGRCKVSATGTDDMKVGLITCFHKGQKGSAYNSLPSTASSSLDRGYRHYEEISFEDMPPPPLELLYPLALAKPSSHCHQGHTVQPQRQLCGNTTAHLDTTLGTDISSFQYLQMRRQQQHYTIYQHRTPENTPPEYVETPEVVTQAPPRHGKQQRPTMMSAQQHVTPAIRCTNTLRVQRNSQNSPT